MANSYITQSGCANIIIVPTEIKVSSQKKKITEDQVTSPPSKKLKMDLVPQPITIQTSKRKTPEKDVAALVNKEGNKNLIICTQSTDNDEKLVPNNLSPINSPEVTDFDKCQELHIARKKVTQSWAESYMRSIGQTYNRPIKLNMISKQKYKMKDEYEEKHNKAKTDYSYESKKSINKISSQENHLPARSEKSNSKTKNIKNNSQTETIKHVSKAKEKVKFLKVNYPKHTEKVDSNNAKAEIYTEKHKRDKHNIPVKKETSKKSVSTKKKQEGEVLRKSSKNILDKITNDIKNDRAKNKKYRSKKRESETTRLTNKRKREKTEDKEYKKIKEHNQVSPIKSVVSRIQTNNGETSADDKINRKDLRNRLNRRLNPINKRKERLANRDNLRISISNKDNVGLGTSKKKTKNKSIQSRSKKVKKIKLVINLICDQSKHEALKKTIVDEKPLKNMLSTTCICLNHLKENKLQGEKANNEVPEETKTESTNIYNSVANIDLSFLDDFNIDEIVDSLGHDEDEEQNSQNIFSEFCNTIKPYRSSKEQTQKQENCDKSKNAESSKVYNPEIVESLTAIGTKKVISSIKISETANENCSKKENLLHEIQEKITFAEIDKKLEILFNEHYEQIDDSVKEIIHTKEEIKKDLEEKNTHNLPVVDLTEDNSTDSYKYKILRIDTQSENAQKTFETHITKLNNVQESDNDDTSDLINEQTNKTVVNLGLRMEENSVFEIKDTDLFSSNNVSDINIINNFDPKLELTPVKAIDEINKIQIVTDMGETFKSQEEKNKVTEAVETTVKKNIHNCTPSSELYIQSEDNIMLITEPVTFESPTEVEFQKTNNMINEDTNATTKPKISADIYESINAHDETVPSEVHSVDVNSEQNAETVVENDSCLQSTETNNKKIKAIIISKLEPYLIIKTVDEINNKEFKENTIMNKTKPEEKHEISAEKEGKIQIEIDNNPSKGITQSMNTTKVTSGMDKRTIKIEQESPIQKYEQAITQLNESSNISIDKKITITNNGKPIKLLHPINETKTHGKDNDNITTRKVNVQNDTEESNSKNDKTVEIKPVTIKLPTKTVGEETNKNILIESKVSEKSTIKGVSNLLLVENLENRMLGFLKKKFTALEIVHVGRFSKILRCKDEANKNYAVKITNSKHDSDYGIRKEDMLMNLQEEKIREKYSCLYLINGFSLNGQWCFIFDFYSKSLRQVLDEQFHPFHIDLVQKLARQLAEAVNVLKQGRVVHADIKPQHILLNDTKTCLKLCGFDRAYYVEQVRDPLPTLGSRSYRAPEAILGFSAGHSIDIWAAALVMHEMATNIRLFIGKINNCILYQQQCIFGKIPANMIMKSEFGHLYFVNQFHFKRNINKEIYLVSKFHKSNSLYVSIYKHYKAEWKAGNTANIKSELLKLKLFYYMVHGMLCLPPYNRVCIENVITDPFLNQ